MNGTEELMEYLSNLSKQGKDLHQAVSERILEEYSYAWASDEEFLEETNEFYNQIQPLVQGFLGSTENLSNLIHHRITEEFSRVVADFYG